MDLVWDIFVQSTSKALSAGAGRRVFAFSQQVLGDWLTVASTPNFLPFPCAILGFWLSAPSRPVNDGSNKAPVVSRIKPRPHSCDPPGADATRSSSTFSGTFFFGTFSPRKFFGTITGPFRSFAPSERERAPISLFVNSFPTDSSGKTTVRTCGATGIGWGIRSGGGLD